MDMSLGLHIKPTHETHIMLPKLETPKDLIQIAYTCWMNGEETKHWWADRRPTCICISWMNLSNNKTKFSLEFPHEYRTRQNWKLVWSKLKSPMLMYLFVYIYVNKGQSSGATYICTYAWVVGEKQAQGYYTCKRSA